MFLNFGLEDLEGGGWIKEVGEVDKRVDCVGRKGRGGLGFGGRNVLFFCGL